MTTRFDCTESCSGYFNVTKSRPDATHPIPKPLNHIGPKYDYGSHVNTPRGYLGINPLVKDPIRNQVIPLDTPPLTSAVQLNNIYSTNYPTNYKDYPDIRLGNIQYWIPPISGCVHTSPNFALDAQVQPVVFVDPMGTVKPEYKRHGVSCPSIQSNSFIMDTMYHREDLMERLLRKSDQTSWKFYN